MLDDKTAIVLLSGGQDSATCLAIAKEEMSTVYALSFSYGQRHEIELEKAISLSKLAAVPHHCIELPFLSDLNPNALTDSSVSISDPEEGLPSTFVPGRNHLFLSVAAAYAYEKRAKHIYIGVCQTDYSGYPDCREAFIKSCNHSIHLAFDLDFKVHAPLMHLSKAETVALMAKKACLSWYTETHSCYRGVVPACGACPACKLRLKGFEGAGVQDPIPYA